MDNNKLSLNLNKTKAMMFGNSKTKLLTRTSINQSINQSISQITICLIHTTSLCPQDPMRQKGRQTEGETERDAGQTNNNDSSLQQH